MIVGDLFSGIGGFSLAARWMGWETRWFAEIDPYCTKVLAKHWPGVPNLGDLTKVDWSSVESVDLIAGGFPCQDLSVAGKRKGITGERSGLWSEYARAVRRLRPRWVVIENVPPLLASGFDVVRGDLRGAGYRVARPVLMSASAVGAPQLRERCWLVAHAESGDRRIQLRERRPQPSGSQPRRSRANVGSTTKQQERESDNAHGAIARTISREGAGWRGRIVRGCDGTVRLCPTEPEVFPVADGVPHRLDGCAAAGNAIVPQVALHIFRAIQAAEERQVA